MPCLVAGICLPAAMDPFCRMPHCESADVTKWLSGGEASCIATLLFGRPVLVQRSPCQPAGVAVKRFCEFAQVIQKALTRCPLAVPSPTSAASGGVCITSSCCPWRVSLTSYVMQLWTCGARHAPVHPAVRHRPRACRRVFTAISVTLQSTCRMRAWCSTSCCGILLKHWCC